MNNKVNINVWELESLVEELEKVKLKENHKETVEKLKNLKDLLKLCNQSKLKFFLKSKIVK